MSSSSSGADKPINVNISGSALRFVISLKVKAMVLLLCGAALAANADQLPAPSENTGADDRLVGVEVTVLRLAPARWEVRYTYAEAVEKVRFQRDRWAFRVDTGWESDSGARLVAEEGREFVEGLDGTALETFVLRFDSDVIKRDREYVLNPRLSDGSEAIYTGLLNVEVLLDGQWLSTEALFRFESADGMRVIVPGEIGRSDARWREASGGQGTYVYFGSIEPVAAMRVTAIVDPGLPPMIHEQFDQYLPRLFEYYEQRLGYPLEIEPFILIGYEAGDDTGLSSSGDVLPGLIRFGFLGDGWKTSDKHARVRAFHLIAHEAAHLWNGERFISAENRDQPWMHEGGADAKAYRAMLDFGMVDEHGYLDAISGAINRCLMRAMQQPLNEVVNIPEIPYACGLAMHALVDLELRDSGGLFGFWQALLRRADDNDGRYASADFFAVLDELAGNDHLSGWLRTWLEGPVQDPRQALIDRLASGGVVTRERIELSNLEANDYLRNLVALMVGQDCQGRYSVSGRSDGLEIEGFEQCTQLKQTVLMTRVDEHEVSKAPAAAYRALLAYCEQGETAPIGVEERREPLELPCPDELPKPIEIVRWPKFEI